MTQRGSTIIELMIAMVVLGIVMAGTYDGMVWINRQTGQTAHSVGLQQAADLAIAELMVLPDNNTRLADDGDAVDLYDAANPDHCRDEANNPWKITIGNATYGIAYNVVRDVGYTGVQTIRVVALFDRATASDPCASGAISSAAQFLDKSFMRAVN